MARVAARVVEARAHGLAHAGSPESAYVSRGAAMARSSQRMCNLGSCWANLDPATALFARSLFGGGLVREELVREGLAREEPARGPTRRSACTRERPTRRSARTRDRPSRRSTRTRDRPARGRGRRAGAGRRACPDSHSWTPKGHETAVQARSSRRDRRSTRSREGARYTIVSHNPHTAKGHPCQKRLSPRTPACS